MDIIQNREARVINIGSLKLKPGLPQEVDSFDELAQKYPQLKAKFDNGQIVKLTKAQAANEEKRVNNEIAARLAKAKM